MDIDLSTTHEQLRLALKSLRQRYRDHRDTRNRAASLANLRRTIDQADRTLRQIPPTLSPAEQQQKREVDTLAELARGTLRECEGTTRQN